MKKEYDDKNSREQKVEEKDGGEGKLTVDLQSWQCYLCSSKFPNCVDFECHQCSRLDSSSTSKGSSQNQNPGNSVIVSTRTLVANMRMGKENKENVVITIKEEKDDDPHLRRENKVVNEPSLFKTALSQNQNLNNNFGGVIANNKASSFNTVTDFNLHQTLNSRRPSIIISRNSNNNNNNSKNLSSSIQAHSNVKNVQNNHHAPLEPANNITNNNTCLEDDDKIEVHCKKCSKDFTSFKLFAGHLDKHRKTRPKNNPTVSSDNIVVVDVDSPPIKKNIIDTPKLCDATCRLNAQTNRNTSVAPVPTTNKNLQLTKRVEDEEHPADYKDSNSNKEGQVNSDTDTYYSESGQEIMEPDEDHVIGVNVERDRQPNLTLAPQLPVMNPTRSIYRPPPLLPKPDSHSDSNSNMNVTGISNTVNNIIISSGIFKCPRDYCSKLFQDRMALHLHNWSHEINERHMNMNMSMYGANLLNSEQDNSSSFPINFSASSTLQQQHNKWSASAIKHPSATIINKNVQDVQNDKDKKQKDKGLVRRTLRSNPISKLKPKQRSKVKFSVNIKSSSSFNSNLHRANEDDDFDLSVTQCPVCPNNVCFRKDVLELHIKRCHPEVNLSPSKVPPSPPPDPPVLNKEMCDPAPKPELEKNGNFCLQEGCQFVAKSAYRLGIHMKRVHSINKVITCSACDETFPNRSSLRKHKKLHRDEPPPPYKCEAEKCKATFRNRKSLEKHKLAHENDKDKKYICLECGRACKTRDSLKVHGRLHSDERMFKCPECPTGYNHKVTLKMHIKRCHPDFTGQL